MKIIVPAVIMISAAVLSASVLSRDIRSALSAAASSLPYCASAGEVKFPAMPGKMHSTNAMPAVMPAAAYRLFMYFFLSLKNSQSPITASSGVVICRITKAIETVLNLL